MRLGVKLCLAVVVFGGFVLGLGSMVEASRGGVTVTPGTLTLTMEPNASEQSAEFSLTNHYDQPISLRFAFEPRVGATQPNGAASQALSVSRAEITLEPNQSAQQKVTIHDRNLGPGSHLADLVITQSGGSAPGVGVEPSIRVSLTILKQTGAITKMDIEDFAISRLNFDLPSLVSATIRNSGNVIVVPRGIVTISKLEGTIVRQGVLNTGSTAIGPEGTLSISTPLTNLATKPFLPGIYRATINYGPGGDQASASVSRAFIYIAWWHVVALIALIVASRYLIKYRKRRPGQPLTAQKNPGPKREVAP